MNHAGNHIGTAGGHTAAHNQAQANAQHDSAVQGTEQGICGQRLQGQDINKHGKENGGQQAAERKNPPHGPVPDQKQGNVQNQGYGTNGPAEQVVQDHGDTRDSAGSNPVRRQEQRVGGTADERTQKNLGIGKKTLGCGGPFFQIGNETVRPTITPSGF